MIEGLVGDQKVVDMLTVRIWKHLSCALEPLVDSTGFGSTSTDTAAVGTADGRGRPFWPAKPSIRWGNNNSARTTNRDDSLIDSGFNIDGVGGELSSKNCVGADTPS